MPLRYTLVTDGSSDRSLLPVIDWICRQYYQGILGSQWFDPRLFAPPSLSLKNRVIKSLELYPCDVLFIHRDAERENIDRRYAEIAQATADLKDEIHYVPFVCVVPVRMTEAWLLFNEDAIRKASGNPNGTMDLGLPQLNLVDQHPDPKKMLFRAIKTASGRSRRRLKKLNLSQCRHYVAEFICDYSPLRTLQAFKRLEDDIMSFVDKFQNCHT